MRLALVSAAALALLAPGRASASPEDVFGYGPRSIAMGGAGVASAEGYEAAYANPALLARVRTKRLALGFQGATFGLHAEGAPGSGHPGALGYAPMHGTVVGAELPLPLRGALRDRIGLGLAFYAPTDVVVRGRILYPERPQFPLLPDRTQSAALRAGIGVDVGWGLRVGAGFAALAEVVGSAVIATDATGRVGARVEDQLVAAYAPVLGASFELGRPGAITRVGLVYRAALEARFAVTIDASRLSSLNLPLFNISGVAQYDPAQLALEVAREEGPWTLALGAAWRRWSAYPGLLEPTLRCPAEEPDCPTLLPPAIAYGDTVAVRAGAERAIALARAVTLRLRAGALLEPSPLPSQLPAASRWDASAGALEDVPVRYYDATRLGGALGVGTRLEDPLPPLDLDVFAQAQALLPRTVESAGGAGPARVSGRALTAGFTVAVRF